MGFVKLEAFSLSCFRVESTESLGFRARAGIRIEVWSPTSNIEFPDKYLAWRHFVDAS